MAGKDEKPDIRFSGFTDAWKQWKLGEIYTERNERGDDSLQILSVSIHHGISNEELDSNTLGKKVRRSEDKTLYKHVYFGDLVLNMMRAWQGAMGVVKSEGMVSPAYITAIPSAQLYPLFMDYCLRRDETIIQMNNLSYGVTDFRKRLYWDSFINVMCRTPSVPEQERIMTFFTQLDNLITLHQSKYDKLVIFKKSMLEKMFPKDESNVPEIRIAGFTDVWEQRELGEDVADITGGGTPSTSNPAYWGGDIDWYSPTEIGEKVYANGSGKKITELGLQKSSAKILPAGKTILFTSRAGIGDMAILQRSGATSQGFQSLVLKDGYDTYFIYSMGHLIKQYAEKHSSGSTFLEISGKTLGMMKIKVPLTDEQIQIGSFFKHLDNLITLHQRKLEKLKNIKKAMLEKMFV